MIQMFHVDMCYKSDIQVLHDITIEVEKGEFLFLVGASGAGKTTILRLLYRELHPTSGSIIVAGKNLSRIRRSEVPYFRRRIGVIFQDFKLLPHKTVEENIALAMKVTGAKRSTIRIQTDQLMRKTGLTHRKDALPEDISGGEQQRVAIARAMANDPQLLLADEPTGNLDPEISTTIMQLFEDFNQGLGTTVLIATHDVALAEQMNKRVIHIEEGRISTYELRITNYESIPRPA